MYNPKTHILETFAIVYGPESGQWFHQLPTLEQAKDHLKNSKKIGSYLADSCWIEKWTFVRRPHGDDLIQKEKV